MTAVPDTVLDNTNVIPVDWPQPSSDAMAHSEALVKVIKADIKAQGGIIDFTRYMQHALYAPGLGYYTAGANKFGPAGDFITAPEISPLFGRCLARQCQQALLALSKTADGAILEVGAGSGKLARDILLELTALDCLPARYFILESSADLRQRQQALLQNSVADYFDHIEWLDALPAAPFSGVVLANEFLDALPVNRLIKSDNQFQELGVIVENGCLQYKKLKAETIATSTLQQRLEPLSTEFDTDYIAELCLAMDGWIASLAACLQQALILFIDYGSARHEYYHPQRAQGSLRCHYRHRAHDAPFVYPGLQDITAHVDFTALAEAAINNQLEVLGYTNQAYFLMSCGLTENVDMESATDVERVEIAQQIRRLTLPGEMGETFKVMALGCDLPADLLANLLGFSIRDLRGHL
ncbi:SAM-dependent methyltransferase [Gammaproteobacteria bacterium AH-315-M22]|nr:SAM-dependent methyltransferase [Gammaproteobacteria bacterium AH-315-M22]